MADHVEEGEHKSSSMHQSAYKQAKDCYRKGLGIVKDIYRKFSGHKDFIDSYTETVYEEIIKA